MSQPIVQSSNGAAPTPSSTSSGAPPATEVTPKAQRRTFTAAYKQQILQEADRCRQRGQLGALLRREGLYSSHLITWRRQRDRGELGTKKRGKTADPQAKEVARLKRQNAQLQAKLDQAETIIAVQKKLCDLLGLPAGDSPKGDNK
jgi:transposase